MSRFLSRILNHLTTTPMVQPHPPLASRLAHSWTKQRANTEVDILLFAPEMEEQQHVITALTEVGFWVHVVSNAEAAVKLMSLRKFALALLSCSQTDEAAIELARRIRSLPSDVARTPLVALSGLPMDERARCFTAGIDDFISVPFHRNDLQNLVFNWLATGPAFDHPEEIFEVFLRIMPGYVSQISSGHRQSDWKKIYDASHSVKSSCANIGAFKLSRLAEITEYQSYRLWKAVGTVHIQGETITALELEYFAVASILQKHLARHRDHSSSTEAAIQTYPFRG